MEDDPDQILPIRSRGTVSVCAVTVELNQPRLHLKVDTKISRPVYPRRLQRCLKCTNADCFSSLEKSVIVLNPYLMPLIVNSGPNFPEVTLQEVQTCVFRQKAFGAADQTESQTQYSGRAQNLSCRSYRISANAALESVHTPISGRGPQYCQYLNALTIKIDGANLGRYHCFQCCRKSLKKWQEIASLTGWSHKESLLDPSIVLGKLTLQSWGFCLASAKSNKKQPLEGRCYVQVWIFQVLSTVYGVTCSSPLLRILIYPVICWNG